MEILPLRWQGASRIDALRRALAGRIADWLSQWAVPAARVDAVVEPSGAHRPGAVDAATGWYVAADGDARLALRIDERTFERLGALLAGTADEDASGLAAGIGRRALAALARGCLSEASTGWRRIDGAPPPADVDIRHGAVGFQIAIGAAAFELRLDAAACLRLVPARDVGRAPLATRREAIATIDATFDAVLDLGRVPLADSLAFAPGDVVRTAIPLTAGLRLVADGGEAVLAGALVADGDRRALHVTQLRPTGDTAR